MVVNFLQDECIQKNIFREPPITPLLPLSLSLVPLDAEDDDDSDFE